MRIRGRGFELDKSRDLDGVDSWKLKEVIKVLFRVR